MASKKDLISIADFSREEVVELLLKAIALKSDRCSAAKALCGKTLAMILQKPSTRTSVSFAAGMVQLGGFPLILNFQDLQIKRGESFQDTAKILSRFVDGIMIRANHHCDVLELAKDSSIPIINGLTDQEHPCQILADMQTIYEKKRLTDVKDFARLRLAYIGDGNNVVHSLMLACAILGVDLSVASPEGYAPQKEYVQQSLELAKQYGGKLHIVEDPHQAAQSADILYTDVWTSMGKDEECQKRKEIFKSYQINADLLKAASSDCIVMHCLPAHRGEEITSDVLDGKNSVVIDQAENRLHMQKAILLKLLLS